MDETSIREYIARTFAGVNVVDALGASFFFYDTDHKFPFATLVTSDEHDQASNLSRPSVFRLNVGVSKQTFLALFGSPVSSAEAAGEGAHGAVHLGDTPGLEVTSRSVRAPVI